MSVKCHKKKTRFDKVNLVSDIAGLAQFQDPNLVNSWGLSHSPTGPWWVSDNGTGVATLYLGTGQAFPVGNPLVVTIPPPAGGEPPSTPTGNVFNPNTSTFPNEFVVTSGANSGPAFFLFAAEDGTISGWNPNVDPTNAILAVDRSSTGAVYKGIALGDANGQRFLFATNFNSGFVEVFDSNFNLVNSFTDPQLASTCPVDSQCFAPFNVRNIKGKLYVTFALQDEDHHDDVRGLGNGFIDIFDVQGNFVKRLISRGALNSPWGLAKAPKHFGEFSCALLVGNFGDGLIHAYNICNGDFIGTLKDTDGNPIFIDGLWALDFGNDAQAGPKNVLFFTAGPFEEAHGLFGFLKKHK